jgi:hypothetical protein
MLFQPLKRLPDSLLFQDLPDFSFLTLLSHNTKGSVHNEGVSRWMSSSKMRYFSDPPHLSDSPSIADGDHVKEQHD